MIAEIDGQPAGFKLGYQRQETVFYSWLGGVLPAFRRHGVAQALLAEQERWARAQGYRQLTVKTRNRFRAMLAMLLAHHYQIVQLEKKGEVADYRLLLEKLVTTSALHFNPNRLRYDSESLPERNKEARCVK